MLELLDLFLYLCGVNYNPFKFEVVINIYVKVNYYTIIKNHECMVYAVRPYYKHTNTCLFMLFQDIRVVSCFLGRKRKDTCNLDTALECRPIKVKILSAKILVPEVHRVYVYDFDVFTCLLKSEYSVSLRRSCLHGYRAGSKFMEFRPTLVNSRTGNLAVVLKIDFSCCVVTVSNVSKCFTNGFIRKNLRQPSHIDK